MPLFVLAVFSETAPLCVVAVLGAAAIAATLLGLHLAEEIDDAHLEAQGDR